MDYFNGHLVEHLIQGPLELDYLSHAGPRIVGLRYKGSLNLLAEAPEIMLPTPYGDYRYLGGHRLWHAPEAMPRSYIPDGEGLVASRLADGVLLEGRVEPGTGIRKRLEIHLNADRPRVTLVHTLANEGLWDVELAPWTITMFRLGGAAILPCRAEKVDSDALLPDRCISFWAYSHLDDPRLHLEDEFIGVRPSTDLPPFKIGAFNPRGWTACWLENILFRKDFPAQPGLPYPDNGCNAEIYCDSHFMELESLGPLGRLAPGGSVTHEETWELYDSLDQSFLSHKMVQYLTRNSG